MVSAYVRREYILEGPDIAAAGLKGRNVTAHAVTYRYMNASSSGHERCELMRIFDGIDLMKDSLMRSPNLGGARIS